MEISRENSFVGDHRPEKPFSSVLSYVHSWQVIPVSRVGYIALPTEIAIYMASRVATLKHTGIDFNPYVILGRLI